ncbi:MAG: PAS domain S-box protein [Ignavibacteria bacterium]
MNTSIPQSILMHAPFGYAYHKIIKDKKGIPIDYQYIEINPAFEKMSGKKAKDVIGKKFTEIFSFESNENFNLISFCRIMSAKNGKHEFEYFSIHTNEWYKISSFNVKKDYFISYYTEIDKEKKSKENVLNVGDMINLVLENIPQAVFIQTDSKFAYVNKKCLKLYGAKSPSELVGKPVKERIHKDYHEIIESRIKKLNKKKEKVLLVEQVHKKIDGTYINVEVSGVPFRYNGLDGGMAFLRDITSYKKAEQKAHDINENLRITLNSIAEAVIATDIKGRITGMNPRAENMLGIKFADAENKVLNKFFVTIDSKTGKKSEDLIKKALITGDALCLSYGIKLITVKGEEFLITNSAAPIKDRKGDIVGAVIVFRDVTEENKMRESILLSEERFRRVTSIITDIVYSCTADKNGVYSINWMAGASEKICGYSINEIMSKKFWEFIVADEDNELFNKNVTGLKTGMQSVCKLRIKHKDGNIKWVESHAECVKSLKSNKESILYGSLKDITEKKRAEDELWVKDWAIESSTNAFVTSDMNGYLNYVNPAFLKMWGYSSESEVLGKNGVEFWKFKNEAKDLLKIVQDTGFWNGEFKGIKKDGSVFDVEVLTSRVVNNEGEGVCLQASYTDITERKKAENQIRENEERLKLALAVSKQGIYDLDIKSGKAIITPEYARMIGFEPEEFSESHEAWNSRLHPDDKERVIKLYEDYLNGLSTEYSVEFRDLTKSGEWKWILSTGKITEYDSFGKPLRMLGTHIDINERKKVEEENKKLAQIFESSLNEIFLLDSENLKFKYVNKAAINNLGYTLEELYDMTPLDLVPEDSLIQFLNFIDPSTKNTGDNYRHFIDVVSLLKTGKKEQFVFETFHRRKDGSIYDIEVHLQFMESGNEGYYVAVIIDISERKKAEEKLKTSDKIFTHSIEMLCITGYDGYLKVLNPAWTSTLGWSAEELLSKPWNEFVHPDDVDLMNKIKAEIIEGKGIYEFENRYRCKDGSYRILSWNSHPYPEEGIMFEVARDITSSRKTEQEYKKLFEEMLDGFALHEIICDEEGRPINYRFLAVNPMYEKMTGLNSKDIVGKTVLEVLPNLEKKWIERYGKVALTEEPIYFEDYAEELDKHYEVKAFSPLKNQFVTIISDITARKNAEIELIKEKEKVEETEKQFRILFENSPDIVALTDINGVFLDINRVTPGNKKEEILGTNIKDILTPEDKRDCDEAIKRALETGLPQTYEPRMKNPAGIYEYWNNRISAIRRENEEVLLVINFTNVTEQKKIEEEILNAKELSEANEIILRNQTEEIILNNERLESLLKISQFQTSSNQELLDFALEEAIQLTRSKIGYIYFYNGTTRQFTLNTWSKDVMSECNVENQGTIYDLDSTGCWGEAVRQRRSIILNDYEAENELKQGTPEGHVKLKKFLTIPVIVDNEIVAVAGVANKETDYDSPDERQLKLLMDNVWKISERLKLIENLKSAKQKAEESDKLKSAFLANMSHEIRTPMNGILGFLDLLKEPSLSEDSKSEYIKIVNQSGERLLNTINDIIEISKIEAGQLQLSFSDVNISEIMEYHYQFFKQQANDKGIELRITEQIQKEESIIISDKHKIDGILTNLIKNAIKFTSKGFIEFGNYVKENSLIFFVRDTGFGIPAEKVDAIFGRFVQGDLSPYTRSYEGSGLGLSIVKAYIELLNGKIWVESKLHEGSIFYFSLPYNPVSQTITISEPSEPIKYAFQKSDKILIAEDDDVSYEYIEKILSKEGLIIMRAANGEEAVNKAKGRNDISLILMDIKMPIMNGIDATKEIRKFNKDIPIIAQTAYAMIEDRRNALVAGCTDYISKPLSRTLLIYKLNNYLNKDKFNLKGI